VNVVPHTHWDREWYEPFEVFRLRLVDMLDDLVPRLESGDAGPHFMLDGQTAILDDYLELRPEMASRLRALGESGRLGIGPWYVLMDEFLVSGETIVRNLQRGLQHAAAYGGAMQVGYLPDMFGHIAQMPQILRLAGFEHAVVWRGVPAAVDRCAFLWSAPDGSLVRAEYLPQGYGNGAVLPTDPAALVDQVNAFATRHEALLVGDILWMNGTDHQAPAPYLRSVVAAANTQQTDCFFEITSLAAHLRAAPTDGLAQWSGELRSSARANLLMGVVSNRVDVKQAAATAEQSLERVAEPLCALFTDALQWPERALDLAWREVIRNAAHDSICACSSDSVVGAVLQRYASASQTATALTDRAASAFARTLTDAGWVACNTTARARRGALVEIEIDGDDVPPGMQLVRAEPLDLRHAVPTQAAHLVAEREVEVRPRGSDVSVTSDGAGHATITVRQPPRLRVLASVDVPGFGWTTVEPSITPPRPVLVDDGGRELTNGLVSITVDQADGTFAIGGARGLARLVNGGDAGDTYNYSPPDADLLIDRPIDVRVDCIERGPLRARLLVDRTYRLPERVDCGARIGLRTGVISTALELRAGESMVRVTTTLDNVWRDHRLRVHFPLPVPARTSSAGCAYATIARGLTAEGGPTEVGLPTFPARNFVRAGGLTIVHAGVLEYELIDVRPEDDGRPHAHELALTLLRCTGMLSQGPMANRPLPAGPEVLLDGPQLPGRQTISYAVHVGDADPYELADLLVPLPVVRGPGGGATAASGSHLDLTGAEVTAVVRAQGALQVRVFNPRHTATTVHLPGRRGEVVDLFGNPLTAFADRYELGPWQIATLRLDVGA
jgi:alpha-mannosidase